MLQLYTCQEIAERYRVEVITVWDWIRKKKLKLDAIIRLATEISNILNQPGKPFTPQLNNTTLSVR